MARIRTIKPEAFSSESLAAVSITAERTFFGLLTQADDHGRFRDQSAVIAGLLWSLRPEHGPIEVEDDLTQLAGNELICRYEGEDGKRYLHIVTFSKHQKVNRPSGVRHPNCPYHDGGRVPLTSPLAQGGLREASVHHPAPVPELAPTPHAASMIPISAGQDGFSEPSVQHQQEVREPAPSPHGPDLGPRIMDLGSPLGGASASATPQTATAHQLVAEYAAACGKRPPESVLGHVGREIKKLLREGIDPEHVRAGVERMRVKSLHPSLLPSLVNEAMNPPQATAGARRAPQPYTNPVDAEAAYGGQL
ncbi:hypothetical protein ACFRSX_21175 [Streptomyces goshikiensis]|uniref:hypothetical protein n=1 Tax=Streptomyces TaxID=1883 RepID=UPI000C274CD8|nr:hypothetical protein [Streptomyces sp. CB02120-2]PJN20720.1 hypothetical protein CG724_02830 [Streptomyces sp. CB02120-2]